MAVLAVPEWLRIRDGSIVPGYRPETVFVSFGGQPHYRLDVRPALGKYTCAVLQTENGRRLDSGESYPSFEEAQEGGLAVLRTGLGW